MSLPFTHDEFLAVFAEYNGAWWPIALALWVSSVVLGVALLRRRQRLLHRAFAGLLAVQWAWSGGIYHLLHFRDVNPAATAFGVLFLIQAAVLLWLGVVRSRLRFEPARSSWGRVGLGFAAYAVLYPLLALLSGLEYPRIPTFGVPCPTTILTAGALLTVPRRRARAPAVATLVWSAIGGSAAFLLGVWSDLALLAAGSVLIAYVLTPEPRSDASPSLDPRS